MARAHVGEGTHIVKQEAEQNRGPLSTASNDLRTFHKAPLKIHGVSQYHSPVDQVFPYRPLMNPVHIQILAERAWSTKGPFTLSIWERRTDYY